MISFDINSHTNQINLEDNLHNLKIRLFDSIVSKKQSKRDDSQGENKVTISVGLNYWILGEKPIFRRPDHPVEAHFVKPLNWGDISNYQANGAIQLRGWLNEHRKRILKHKWKNNPWPKNPDFA